MPITAIINHIFAGGIYGQIIVALHPGSPQACTFAIWSPQNIIRWMLDAHLVNSSA